MSIVDKVTGRIKKTLGDVKDDPQTRQEGRREELKGEKKEQLDRAATQADRKAEEVADLERRT